MREIPPHIVEIASRAYVSRQRASINDRIVDALLAIDLPELLAAATGTNAEPVSGTNEGVENRG